MKKLLAVLALVLALGFGSSASAQDAYFGVRLGIPFLIGVQGGANFDSFGVRAQAEGTFIGGGGSFAGIFHASVDAFYRAPILNDGSSVYGGLGVGFIGAGSAGGGTGSLGTGLAARLIFGVELMLGRTFGLCFELAPLWLGVGQGGAALVPVPASTIAGNFYFGR